MTTIIDNLQIRPLVKSLKELQSPLFLVNGKLKRIDTSLDQRHVFRFIEIMANLTKHTIPVDIFTEAFLHFQYLNELLQESHSNNKSFNNDDVLAYFLAILYKTLLFHDIEFQERHFYRIMKFWGIEKEINLFSKKVTQATIILENANLLRYNSKKCKEELLSKSNLIVDYLKDILPRYSNQLEQIFEYTESLIHKKIVPFANSNDAALIMVVSFFPLFLEIPAVKLYIMLNLKKDLKINLAVLKKDVARFSERLAKYNLLKLR